MVKDFAKGTNTFGDPKIFPAMRWLKLRDQLIEMGTLSVDDRRFYYDSEKAYTEEVLARAWIMGSTLNNSIMMRDLNWVPSICIIDEAAQALEPDTVIPLAIFQPYLRVVILAGDDSQLRPTVLSNAKTNEFIHSTSMSLMECLINSQVHPIILLGENFRCRPEITDLVSKHFYEGKLQSHKSRQNPSRCYIAFMDVAEQMEWPDVWGPSNMFFVDVVDGISRRDAAFSRYNFANVTVIMRMLADLLTHTDNILAQDVTILTPYKAQVIRLERMIQGAMEISPEWGPLLQGVTVSTIDNYQGRDNEIVFLDLVLAGGNERKAGFMSDKHRLNVALSRAKDVLIVVGNKAKLKRIGGLKSTAEDAQRLLSVIEDVGPTYVAEAGKCPDCNESLHPGSYCHGTGNLLG